MTIHVRLRTYFIEYPVIFFWVSIVLNDDDLVTVTVCVKNHVSYSNPINTDIYNRIRTRHMVSPNRLCSKAVSPYFINTYPPHLPVASQYIPGRLSVYLDMTVSDNILNEYTRWMCSFKSIFDVSKTHHDGLCSKSQAVKMSFRVEIHVLCV